MRWGGHFGGNEQQYYIGAFLSCQYPDSRQEIRRSSTACVGPSPPLDWSAVPLRIGLFGGTFDPPHVGHLVTAVNVRHALSLDAVVLMVANSPWQKWGTRPITSAEDRLAMVEAAVADVDGSGRRRRRDPPWRAELHRRHAGHAGRALSGRRTVHDRRRRCRCRLDDVGAARGSGRRGRSWSWSTGRARRWCFLRGSSGCESRCPDWKCRAPTCAPRVRDGRPLDYLVTEPVLDIIAARQLYRYAA